MKTDAKTMAEIWREIENNPDAIIQLYIYHKSEWIDVDGVLFDPVNDLYRIKPKTIIVNGVEIPKPLDVSELNLSEGEVYSPSAHFRLFHTEEADIAYRNFSLNNIYYLTMQEAIEASKKLFGIE